jgi:hypothetical protein
LSAEDRPVLSCCVRRPDHVNAKVEELKEVIFRLYKDKPQSRVIVLIKTRELVQAIENWMKETDGLSCLNPVKFVGAQASEEKGGKHVAIMYYPFSVVCVKTNKVKHILYLAIFLYIFSLYAISTFSLILPVNTM